MCFDNASLELFDYFRKDFYAAIFNFVSGTQTKLKKAILSGAHGCVEAVLHISTI